MGLLSSKNESHGVDPSSWGKSFAYITLLLKTSKDLNPGTQVNSDVDDQNRFLRAFATVGLMRQSVQRTLKFEFDGTHSNHDAYKETVLTFIGEMATGPTERLHSSSSAARRKTTFIGSS